MGMETQFLHRPAHSLFTKPLIYPGSNGITVKCKLTLSGFGGLCVACCLEVPKFAGSNPTEAVRIFQGEKILSTPSIGREVKPWVPCRRFAAGKRSLNWCESRNLRQNYRLILAHTVPPFATRISRIIGDVGVPGGERGNVQTEEEEEEETHPHALPPGNGSKWSQCSESSKRPQHLQVFVLLDKQTKYGNLNKRSHSVKHEPS